MQAAISKRPSKNTRRLNPLEYTVTPQALFCTVFSLFIVLSFMERIYSPGKSSGTFNSAITLLYVGFGVAIIAAHLKSLRFDGFDLAAFVAVAYFAFHSYGQRSFLYATIVVGIYCFIKIRLSNLAIVHRLLVCLGLLCCLAFCLGSSRWSGFFTSSAPVFALVMTCSVLYLLFSPQSGKIDYVLAAIATAMIAMTQTRILLLAALVLWVGRFAKRRLKSFENFLKAHKIIAAVLILAFAVFIALNYEDILGLVSRDGGDDSNRTRIKLMTGAISQWVATPFSLLFGNGGGYAMAYTAMANASYTGNLPVHQDILMLLCDYGVIGFAVFCLALYPAFKNWPWYCWLVLAVATFHNVFTTGATVLLMFMTFQALSTSRALEVVDV